MAVVQYQAAVQTVDNISDRNNPNIIKFKRDGLIVTVSDAIGDPMAGPGAATYLWNKTLNKWLLMSKTTTESMFFQTAELTISNGEVSIPNIPNNNLLWDIYVIDTNGVTVIAEIRLEDIAVSYLLVSGINSIYNGKKLRFTYAFGTVGQQIDSFVNEKLTPIENAKVDKIAGKDLSTNDFTNDYKDSLDLLNTKLAELNTTTVMIILN